MYRTPSAAYTRRMLEAVRTGTFVWSVHRPPTDGDVIIGIMLIVPYMLGLLLYFAWPQYRARPSPGDLLLGIRVTQTRPRPLSLSNAMGRVLLGMLAFSAWFITVPLALADPEKRMWQDKAYGTRVVKWSE